MLAKVLRMPPGPIPRKLWHSVAFCTEVYPVSFSAVCRANLLRSESESEYLLQLHARVTDIRSVCPRVDNTTLSSISAPACGSNLLDLPSGGLSDPPLLVNLLNAIKLSGPFSCLDRCCCASRQGSRHCDVCFLKAVNSMARSFQSAALQICQLIAESIVWRLNFVSKLKSHCNLAHHSTFLSSVGMSCLLVCVKPLASLSAAGLRQ